MKAIADLITEFQINLSAHTPSQKPLIKMTIDAHLFKALCREMDAISIYRTEADISYLSGKATFRGIELEATKESE